MLIYRVYRSNCRPLWFTLDPNVVMTSIFLKFSHKDTQLDNSRLFCLMASWNNYTREGDNLIYTPCILCNCFENLKWIYFKEEEKSGCKK